MTSFEQLQLKVKTALNEDLKADRISFVEVMSALFVLGQAKNEAELVEAINMFQDGYSTLRRILEDDQKSEQEASEASLEDLVSRVIKEDPILAAKVAQESKLNVDQIVEKYPEVKKYL